MELSEVQRSNINIMRMLFYVTVVVNNSVKVVMGEFYTLIPNEMKCNYCGWTN